MLGRKTVFVVGAGASSELGFPLGSDLKYEVAKLANLKYKLNRTRVSGDEEIEAALRQLVRKDNHPDGPNIGPYVRAGQSLSQAIPLSTSIDNYLDAQRTDIHTNVVGKLAIARAILMAEERCDLCVNKSEQSPIDFRRTKDVWLHELVQKLNEGLGFEDVDQIFSKVDFITFNYDRCIEQFLYSALATHHPRITSTQLAQIMLRLNVFHMYGAVGDLPWQNSANYKEFGGGARGITLLDVSKKIRTFTEQFEDELLVEQVRERLLNAEVLVFLGFAFNEQNMRLLNLEAPAKTRVVYATTYGLHESAKGVVRQRITSMFPKTQNLDAIVLEDTKCFELIRNYRHSL